MTINIHFDILNYIFLVALGFLTGYAGNLLAAIITAIRTPSLDGQSLWTFAALVQLAIAMLPVKILVAIVVAAVAMAHYDAVGDATLATIAGTATIGFLFTLLAGSGRSR